MRCTTGLRAAPLAVLILGLSAIPFQADSGMAAGSPGYLIEGRATGPEGRGIAGARVELRPVLSSYEEGVREAEGSGEPPPETAVVSGEDGRFQLAAPRAGMWTVTVRAAGSVTVSRSLLPLLEPSILAAVELQGDAGLRVRVEDAEGRPVPGARVRGMPAEPGVQWNNAPPWAPAPRQAVTGEDGEARLARAEGEALRVWTVAEGFDVAASPVSRGSALTLRLRRAAPRRLVVREMDGSAPAGVVVRDPAGGLVLGLLPPGRMRARIAHGTAALLLETADGRRLPVKRLDRDTAQPVRVQLPASALRSAPVVDRGGQPIAGAWVWPFGEPGLAVRSDALGVCRLEASTVLLEGALLAAAPGFLVGLAKVPEPAPATLPSIVLTPAVSLSGVVVDAAGRPQAGARLETVPLAESASLEEAVLTRASAAGEFRVSGLAAGRSYRITAHHPGSASGVIALGPVETSVAGLRVVLRRGAALTGALLDERGEPAAGVAVELLAETGRSLGRTATDGEGRFALSDLPPGRGELVLGRPGAVPLHRPGIEIPEGRTVDLGRLLISGGTTLAGRVTDPDGSPLADVEVQVRIGAGADFSPLPPMAPSPTTLFRHTAADGTFSFSGLEPEQEIHLALCHERSIHEVLKLPAVLPEPLALTLRPAARLSGVIVDAEGSPVPYAFLSTLRRGLTPEHRDPDAPCSLEEEPQAADAEGRFALTPFVPGWYSLIADAPGFQAGHLVIEVLGAGRDDLRIVLESAPAAGSPTGRALPAEDEAEERREVRGHVLSPDGRPVAGATVVSDGALTGTAEDGSFLLSLTDGEHPVRVKPGEYSSGWQETQVLVMGSPVDGVEIRLQATAELRGRISGLEPAELAWARVWVQRGRFEIYPGQVAADGSYRISRLTPGEWMVEVQAGDRKAEQALVLAPGEREAAVDLELAAVSPVSGWVTGPAGEPLPGSTVVFRKDGHTATATAGSDGSFALRLPEGSYTFNAYGGGYHLDGPAGALEVAGPVGGLEMRLVRGTELHGRVVGLAPGEVPWIRADGPASVYADLELELDGTFRLLDLDPGTWTVTANLQTEDGKTREAKRQVTVREGGGDIDLVIDLALDPPPDSNDRR